MSACQLLMGGCVIIEDEIRRRKNSLLKLYLRVRPYVQTPKWGASSPWKEEGREGENAE